VIRVRAPAPPRVLAGLLAALVAAVPCAGGAAPVRVLYAGSLVGLFEDGLAPAFTRATGLQVLGRPGGSVALAHLIRDRLERADVFVSADPGVNRLLRPSGSAPAAAWFLTLARSTVVIAYSPHSRFAAALRDAAAGRVPWYRVLASPGLRVGRTDPALDPKGYRTVLVLKLAEAYYRRPGLLGRLLGDPANPRQVFPEEELVGRLASGQLDAGFFYLTEALEQHLPYIALPDAINLGNPAFARAYAQATYTDPAGVVHRGAPILYTVTISSTARNPSGAVRFVQFLYSASGRALLAAHGLLPVPPRVGGDARAVPRPLRVLAASGPE